MARVLTRGLSTRTNIMLAAIAERIDALGPRFRLPLLAVQAVEAQSGRKACSPSRPTKTIWR